MRSAILTAAAVLMCVSGAHAADMKVKAAPRAMAPPSWTGFYIGINGGGAWGSLSTNASDARTQLASLRAPMSRACWPAHPRASTRPAPCSGGQIGYLFQSGPVIFGLETSFDWSSLKGSTSNGPTTYLVTAPSTFSWNLTGKSDWVATFTGRLGPDLGAWYPYLTGGAALAHIEYDTTYIDTFYPSTSVNNFSKDSLGWVFGAGAEWRVAQNWLLRAEYLHMDFANLGGLG